MNLIYHGEYSRTKILEFRCQKIIQNVKKLKNPPFCKKRFNFDIFSTYFRQSFWTGNTPEIICAIFYLKQANFGRQWQILIEKANFWSNLEFWIMANILIGLFLPKIESDNGYSCVISRHISSSSHFVNSRESTKCDRPIFKITGLSELKPAAKRSRFKIDLTNQLTRNKFSRTIS